MTSRPGPRPRQGDGADPAPLLRAEGDQPVPGGPRPDPAQVPRPAAAPLRRVGHAQVRDLLPVRPGLPDRVHRHGRHRHQGPLRRPLGGARDVRRAARGVGPPAVRAGPCPTRPTSTSTGSTWRPSTPILDEVDHDPREMLRILAAIQDAYGYVPVAALKRVSEATGAWYAMLYGTATYYDHLAVGARETAPSADDAYVGALEGPSTAGTTTGRRAGTRAPDDRPPEDPDRLAAGPHRVAPGRRPDRPRSAVRDGAFEALRTAVRAMTPSQVIGAVVGSGLRGRGGSGFPTGAKWRVAASAPGRHPVRRRQRLRRRPGGPDRPDAHGAGPVRRGRGGRPGGLRDRRRRGDHRRPGRCRRGDPPARGGDRRRRGGRLRRGPTSWSPAGTCRSQVRPVQGAYMLGEETVLLKALEGKRGQPEQRPPHPAERGLFGRPTVVDNVQTLASVPWIVRNGPEAYAAIGSTASPGTILVQLRGAGRRRDRRGAARDAAPGAHRARRPAGRPIGRRPAGQGGPRRRARRAGSCRRTCSTRRTTSTSLRDGRRARRVRLDRRRRRPGLRRRPGPAADPVLRRRGLRQDDPLPDRHPSPVRDRRPDRGRHAAPDRRRRWPPTWPPTSRAPACATTSGWRRCR